MHTRTFVGILFTVTAGCAADVTTTDAPLSVGTVGVDVANTLLASWPDLDATSCGSKCFSLDYAKVPATPNPKFWEYTNGVPLYALWLLYNKTHDARYREHVQSFV